MSDTEQRFGLTMATADRDEPGLIRERDGTVWLVNPDGTRTQLPGSGGGSSIDGGTLLLEVSTELALDNTIQYWSFDPPAIDTTDGDVTLGEDSQTLTIHETGWYVVWYSFAAKASATTVKAQVESQIVCSDQLNWIGQGSFAETQPHLDGAVSLADLTTPFTSPPIHFTAGDTLNFRADAQYAAGSVGDAILSTNTYVTVVRLAAASGGSLVTESAYYSGAPVAAGQRPPWGILDAGTDVLDRSNPIRPLASKDGLYVINAEVVVDAAVDPCQGSLIFDYGVTDAIISNNDVDKGSGSSTIFVGGSYVLTAGAEIRLTVTTDEAATFVQLRNALVSRIGPA